MRGKVLGKYTKMTSHSWIFNFVCIWPALIVIRADNEPPRKPQMRVYKTVAMRCSTSTPGDITYTFFKDDEIVQSGPETTYKLQNPLHTDSGFYKCRASKNGTDSQHSRKYQLAIDAVPPTKPILTGNATHAVPEGTPVTMTCFTSSTGAITYTFFKDGEVIQNGIHDTYTIPTPVRADSGLYRCTATKDGIVSHPSRKYDLTVYDRMAGWTVIQRRVSAGLSFNKGCDQYRQGFGDDAGNLWLGLDNIAELCHRGAECTLRIDLIIDGIPYIANYSTFSVYAANQFRLTVGGYSGDAGNYFEYHSNNRFRCKDRDYDRNRDNHCGQTSGWWCNSYLTCNLNSAMPCLQWYTWCASFSQMAVIRP